jgi:hypothetical protein
MNIIPLDANLVKGSHGRIPESKEDHPVLISNVTSCIPEESVLGVDVYDIIINHLKNEYPDEHVF